MLIERWVQPESIHVELQTWGVVDLRGCFIWTSWCSRAEGHCLWTSPWKAGRSRSTSSRGLLPESSSSKQSSRQATAVLTHSFLPLFLSLLFGRGRGLWKRSSILAEVLLMLEIQLWPLTPTSHSQRWGHPTGSWAPLQLLPRTRLLAEFAF